jgi:hypothetical protein
MSRFIRAAIGFAGATLVGFHAWLFASQIAAGRLEDPWLIFRWISAIALVSALVAVRRAGDSIFGRKGVAIWVLAALLHGPALARELDVVAPSMPEVVATITQTVTVLSLAGSLMLLLLALRRGRRGVPALLALFSLQAPSFAGALPAHSFLRFAPRPPPTK